MPSWRTSSTDVSADCSMACARAMTRANEPAPTPNKPTSNPHQQLETSLSENFGLPVKLQANDKRRGKLTVSFRNAAEMERLLKALQ